MLRNADTLFLIFMTAVPGGHLMFPLWRRKLRQRPRHSFQEVSPHPTPTVFWKRDSLLGYVCFLQFCAKWYIKVLLPDSY